MRIALILASLPLLGGCAAKGVPIPDGCYRIETGEPLFKISGGKGTFIPKVNPTSFTISPASEGKVAVTPHFYLHEANQESYVPKWVPAITEPQRTMEMDYRIENGAFALRIPLEGSGEREVKAGAPC